MKKICLVLLLALAFGLHLSAQINPVLLEKIYGNGEENRPTVIKAFNDGIYVAGYRVVNGGEFATFSKFNLTTGAITWEKIFEIQTHINDFDYEPSMDELFIVGHTTPFSSSVDNRSFLARISGNGNLMDYQSFGQPGREQFSRIVRHPNPVNPTNPFYILGIKNPPTAAPSGADVVVLYNVSVLGIVNWVKEYGLTSPPDDEFHRGLIPFGTGLVLVGDGDDGVGASNDGILVQVDANGNVLNSYSYPHVLDIYDGLDIANGLFAIVGEDFSTNEAFVMILNGSFSTQVGPTPGLRFSNITRFKDIWMSSEFGKLYVIGENKNLSPPYAKNYQIVHKLDLFAHPGVTVLSVDWARYLEDQSLAETDYSNGVISVTPAHDRIFYADARLNNPSGFGNWDMLVGSFDLNLGAPAPCVVDFPFPTTTPFFSRNVINVVATSVTPPSPNNPPVIQPFTFSCIDFCAAIPDPCPCQFTWTTSNCFVVNFDASCPNPVPGNYTYAWDFDGSGGLPDLITNNPLHTHTYPCGGGTYTVSLIITDPQGTKCTVTHIVTVPSTCCGPVSGMLDCTFTPNLYEFTITVTDPVGSGNCNYVLTTPTPGVLSGVATNPGTGGAVITGFIAVNTPIIPLALNFTVQINCLCPVTQLPYTCTQSFSIPTKCCKSIEVSSQSVCETDATLDIPIVPPNGITLNNINQVTWYVMPKPAGGCPSLPWGGMPYQNNYTNVLEPLHLFPDATLSGDLCIYAVVHLNDGPCVLLTSNIAMIHLCAPSTCSLNGYDYCYAGVPVVPGLLTLSLQSPVNACLPNIDWFDQDGNLVNNGTGTYQPTAGISMFQPLVNCYEDFFYTVTITDSCGQRDCQSRIRLYSNDAPKGSLDLALPMESLPLCYGGDATLEFMEGCSGLPPGPPSWTWCDSIIGGTWQPLPAGTLSKYWNTNPLFQDTWYSVKSKNGVCAEDRVEKKIDVRKPLQITSFIAQYDSPCDPTGVYLEVTFLPQPPDPSCPVSVDWYKDGVVISSVQAPAPSPASYTYFTGGGPSLAGNYYCVLKNDCCDERDTSAVVPIAPPCFAIVGGPCFICDNQAVDLQGFIINPALGTTCSYQWTTSNGNIVSVNAAGDIATVDAPGLYVFTALCTDINGVICTKIAYFTLVGCSSGQLRSECGLIVSAVQTPGKEINPVRVFPNPTTGEVHIEWSGAAPKDAQLLIVDLSGKILRQLPVPDAVNSFTTHVTDLPSGIYFVKILSSDQVYTVAKLVKE